MKCKVKRDEQGRFLDVVDPTTGKSDSLYKTILSKITKDPESYIAADEFIQNLYNTNVLVDKTKEEVALGIWAKVHQYWLNTGASPIERTVIPIESKPVESKPAETQSIKAVAPVPSSQFQKLTAEEKAKTIEQVTKEHRSITALKDLSAKLAHRIGGTVEFQNHPNADWKGYNQGMTSVLNEAYMTPDTPFHEILAHPIIRAIKMSSAKIESWYQDKVKSGEYTQEQADEAIKFYYKSEPNRISLYQSLLKELETGRGKEVLDRIKRDYVYKDKEPTQQEIEIATKIAETFKKLGKPLDKSTDRILNRKKYTLEEQQEEAIVTLLGMMASDKLDAKKDATLISKLKELWKQISDFVKSLLKQDGIKIDELPITTTLNDLAEIMAYGNNKIILPGYKVEYSTPLGNKYETLEEVNNEIRDLADADVEVDLNGVKINPNLAKEIAEKREKLEQQLREIEKQISEANEKLNKLVFSGEKMKSKFEFTDEYKAYLQKHKEFTDKNLTPLRNKEREIHEKINDIRLEEGMFGSSGKTILNFIQKNKEYEQSKEIIEQWKKENNIQYDPEEVYSRGQGFYSSIGAYSNLELDLLLKNLIQHIQDNKKAGGEFTISAFTKPIDKRLKHIEGTGDRVRFVIYPKSEHIKWAAPTDVYSGSVWDAHEKVSKDKKSELLGVSFTKAPALRNINQVSPNLTGIIDNLSHAHNELGIELTTNNFRIEYDDNIDYATKKLIDNINKILDDKYGKLVKPEITKKINNKGLKITFIGEIINENGESEGWWVNFENGDSKGFDSKKELNSYINSLQGNYAKQPTQTRENTTSIESVKNEVLSRVDYAYTEKRKELTDYNYNIGKQLDSKGYRDKYGNKINNPFFTKEQLQEQEELFKLYEEGVKKLDNFRKSFKPEKEYTSQALTNLKVATIKEVARKYPRSLITSKVVPINPNMVDNSEIQYSKRENGNTWNEIKIDPIEGFDDIILNETSSNVVDEIFTEYDDFIGGFESYQSFAKLDKQIQKNIDFFDSRMAALRFEQRKLTTGDSKRNEEIKKQLADYERRKAEKEAMYQHARALEGLEAIEQMAAKEMDQLQELINSGDVPLYLLEYIRDNLSFWKAVGNPDPYNPHILYTQEELTPEIVERLKIIGAKAGTLDNIQVEKRLEKAMQELPKKLKGDLSNLREQLRHTKDIGFWSKEALDMSAYGDAVLTWIQVLEKDAVSQAQVRITELISKLESAFEPVKNKLGKNYEILQQKHKDGSPTNKLVYRFSPEFFDAARIARSEFENSPSDKKYSNFAKWISENEILMNPIILFPTKLGDEYHWGQSENMYSDYDESMRQAHIAELKATLGEKDYEMYLKRMKDKLETFSFHYVEAKRSFENAGHDAEQVEIMLKDWELENSPYYWAQRVLNGKSLENSKGLIVRNRGYAYAESIPRKFKEDGSETGYYDKNYEKIQADPQLAEFYEQLLDITSQLSEILPPHKRRELGINGLPFLRKDVTELFSRGNWFGMTTELFDQLVEMTRTQDFGDTDTQERDPFTGNVKYKAKLHLDTGEQAIKDIVQSKMTKYEIDNASEIKKLSSGEVKILKDRLNLQFRKEAIAALQKDRSEDLLTTMKAYIMTAVMYRHKANIEDTLNLMSQIAEDRSAFVMKDGVIQTDDEGKPVLQGVAQNKIDVLRFNVKAFLTGRTHKVEGRTKKKILTSKEKTRKQDLDKLLKEIEDKFISGAIDEKVYTTHKEAIEEQIKNLGGYKEAAKYGDIALRFVQLKGIGWNILSGVNNMVFGFTANSIEAAAGRHFDEKDLSIARRMLTSSALTNASFNHYRDAKSKKIRKMTELFDVLKDASTELYKASNRSPIMSKFRAFLPYQITKRTEYINQGQTFIAYMLHQKVKDLQGKEFSLWEAFDDNGEWKTEQFGKMSQNKFSHTKTSVDQLIKRLHGNYDELSPVMGKESIVGRALFQFKSWFPETWRKYYGKEVTDHILGDQYKGRYRTIWDTMLTGDEKSKTAMQTAMEFLRKYLNVTTLGLIPNFAKEDAFSHLSEIDMQNMKRNIHQFIFMANLFMMYYLLKYLADDDDDEKISTVVANLTIHQIARLTGELEMYSSPAQLSNFTKNILPITVITKDLDEIMQASIKTMKGDYTLQSGAYEGWYSIPKEIGESVPFLAPAMRYNSIIQGKSSSQEASIVEAVIAD